MAPQAEASWFSFWRSGIACARGSIFGRLNSEGVSVETPLRSVLGGIDCDQAIADGFVEHPHEWRDGVLNRRCKVLLLPVIDRAVDHSSGDLR